MTSSIFEKWLRQWDKTLLVQSRKIALALDNCSAHPNLKLNTPNIFFTREIRSTANRVKKYRVN